MCEQHTLYSYKDYSVDQLRSMFNLQLDQYFSELGEDTSSTIPDEDNRKFLTNILPVEPESKYVYSAFPKELRSLIIELRDEMISYFAGSHPQNSGIVKLIVSDFLFL